MNDPITNVEDAVREMGALPVPVGSEPELTPERLAEIRDLIKYESSISFYSHRAKESILLLVAEAEGAARLRARVAELESEHLVVNEALDEAAKALRTHRGRINALVARLRAGQTWRQGRTPPLVSQDYVSQDELRSIFGIPLTAPWSAGAGGGE